MSERDPKGNNSSSNRQSVAQSKRVSNANTPKAKESKMGGKFSVNQSNIDEIKVIGDNDKSERPGNSGSEFDDNNNLTVQGTYTFRQ